MLQNSFFPVLLLAICLAACSKPIETTPTVSVNAIVQAEGDDTSVVYLKFYIGAPYSQEVRVDYATINRTAFAGEDYEATSGTVVYAPGETTKEVAVTIYGDLVYEPKEQFQVGFSNPVNLVLTQGATGINLINDDPFIPATGYTTALTYAGKTLVWNDEFDGPALDASAWTQEIGNGNNGWGNNQLQYYQPENTRLLQGCLILEARLEQALDFNYTSSRITTQGKRAFQYGRIDIRAALPQGQGIWPALWMLGDNVSQVGWPACGEIDLMELIGHEPGKIYGTVHYGPDPTQQERKRSSVSLPPGQNFSDKFHVFSIEWVEDNIKWYLDDQLFFEFSKTDAGAIPYPFNQPHFLLFNLAVGGNRPGNPDNNTVFPQQMVV